MTLARELVGLAHLAQDEDRLYFTNSVEGTVRAVLKAGGVAETIAGAQATPLDVVVDESGAYWVNRESGTVMRATRR